MASLRISPSSPAPTTQTQRVRSLQSHFPTSQSVSYYPLQSFPHSLALTIRTIRISRLTPLLSTATQGPVSDSSSVEVVAEEETVVDGEGKVVVVVEEEEFCKSRVLAANIPWTSTPEDIRALFEKFGTVVDVEEYEGRVLKMNYAKPKKVKPAPVFPKPAPTFSLFISNLPFEAKEKDVKEFFIAGGANVATAEIIYNVNPRKSSGYGFVSFKTKKEAEEALSAFQEKELLGRPIRVARSKQFVRPPRTKAPPTSRTTEINDTEEEEEAVTAVDETI
ncbi:unnamed protein product [Linum tenue]|uniref:RRM domain-containing protein n=1 Tax=Linum tenue TaxID=586396 RepID=A0AAV0MN38_9ROSI|nr:unnamed protein product [Linum tenue]